MKNLILQFSVIMTLGVFVMTSCVKPYTGTSAAPKGVKELIVPEGFDWKSTANVLCNFTSDKATKVYVSLTADAAPFATFYVEPNNGADKVQLSLPIATKSVYVKYTKQDGALSKAQLLDIKGTSIAYIVPNDSKEFVSAQPAAFMKSSRANTNDNGIITYPADTAGWGTLLFEDLWPSYGDYDFNDLVVNYKIQLYLQNKNKVFGMLIGIRVNAIGGSAPNDLYLKLANVKGGVIDYTDRVDGKNDKNVELVALNSQEYQHDAALLKYTNIRTRSEFPAAKYMNTEPGFEVGVDKLLTSTFFVKLRNSVAIEDLQEDMFDFFIAYEKDDIKKEIHTGGYEPVLFSKEIYEQIMLSSPVTNLSTDFYKSNDNLVWALKVPVSIPHAYEGKDFLKVYPEFGLWAESGGTTNLEWYKNRTAGTFIMP